MKLADLFKQAEKRVNKEFNQFSTEDKVLLSWDIARQARRENIEVENVEVILL